jgi:hypothetical protein
MLTVKGKVEEGECGKPNSNFYDKRNRLRYYARSVLTSRWQAGLRDSDSDSETETEAEGDGGGKRVIFSRNYRFGGTNQVK